MLSIFSDLPLTRKTEKAELNDKIDQNINFAKLPSAKFFLVYLQFCYPSHSFGKEDTLILMSIIAFLMDWGSNGGFKFWSENISEISKLSWFYKTLNENFTIKITSWSKLSEKSCADYRQHKKEPVESLGYGSTNCGVFKRGYKIRKTFA